MTQDPVTTIKRALFQMRGDDLYRARRAFDGMTDAQLDEEYGQSGKTRRQILEEYARHDATVTEALDWINKTHP